MTLIEETRITDPAQLADLATHPPQGDNVPSPNNHSVVLALLEPLSQKDMFAACRNPASREMHGPDGRVRGMSKDEYLNIEPLSTAWRHALRASTPLTHIVFDLTLPGVVIDEDGKEHVPCWDTALPYDSEVCMCVNIQHAANLTITLATATRARASGKLSFELRYDEAQRPSSRGTARLEEHLKRLANYEPAGKFDDA